MTVTLKRSHDLTNPSTPVPTRHQPRSPPPPPRSIIELCLGKGRSTQCLLFPSVALLADFVCFLVTQEQNSTGSLRSSPEVSHRQSLDDVGGPSPTLINWRKRLDLVHGYKLLHLFTPVQRRHQISTHVSSPQYSSRVRSVVLLMSVGGTHTTGPTSPFN